MVALAVCIAYFVNSLLTAAFANPNIWTLLDPLPRLAPMGADFLHGMYQPARELMRTGNPYVLPLYSYPPLVCVAAVPLALLPYRLAYTIQLVLLFFSAILSVALMTDATSAAAGRRLSGSSRVFDRQARAVGALVAVLLVTSYGFAFALERGNYDSYAILFSTLAIWAIARDFKAAPLVATILLSIATGLKVYPAILFAVIIWRYGWRWVGAVGVSLTAVMLVAGPSNAHRFAGRLSDVVSNGLSYWIGNHSAASFAGSLSTAWGVSAVTFGRVLLVIPILLWLAGAAIAYRSRRHANTAVAFSALSFPVMSLVPAVSHDYKLVILYPVIAFALVVLGSRIVRDGHVFDSGLLCVVLVVAGLISRSPVYTQGVLLQNKYPTILLLEVVLLFLLARGLRDSGRDHAADDVAGAEFGRAESK